MVAIEHRKKSSTTTIVSVLSATSSTSATSPTTTNASGPVASNIAGQPECVDTCHNNNSNTHNNKHYQQTNQKPATKMSQQDPPKSNPAENVEKAKAGENADSKGIVAKSAVSQRSIDIKIAKKSNMEAATQELTKKVLKLDLTGKELDDYSIKSPKSPITARLPHQTSLTSSVDVEDRKTLREALYQGIFHRHRRTIFAVGSFLRMLRSRNSQYNTIRSSSEGEDVEESR